MYRSWTKTGNTNVKSLIGHWATMCRQYGLYTPWHRVYQDLEFCRKDVAPFFHKKVNQLTLV